MSIWRANPAAQWPMDPTEVMQIMEMMFAAMDKAHLWLSDFRKFAEQFGDIIGWSETNRKYILAHGMTGVDWEHYKHPLPEQVYHTYMRYWRDVELAT